MIARFAPIALPETVRRSDLAGQLRRRVNLFARLLAEVAPREYARTAQAAPLVVNGHRLDTWNYYVALLTWCGDRFPVWVPDYLVEEFYDDEEMLAALAEIGIPVDPAGVRDETLYDGWSATLGVMAYLLEQPVQRASLEDMKKRRVGEAWTKFERLQPYLDRQIQADYVNPPRGRHWSGQWQNLPWLIKYIQHDTGYQWIDLDEEVMDEGGNPPWSLADIEFLTRDWAEAKRIWKPLQAFMQWLDANPEGYLPTALAALTGDEQVRRQISQPKRTKTLAEVFDAEDKKANRARARAR